MSERVRFQVLVTFSDEGDLKRIDDWRRRQPDLPTRPEALRRLVELALAQAKKR